MALQIEDGKGTGRKAEVNTNHELIVRAITENEVERTSETEGQAYIWTSQDLDIDAADTLLLIKNDNAEPLHVQQIIFSAGNAATRYEVHIVTADITPAGNTVTGFNMNTNSGNVAEATAKSDETANTQGTVIYDINLLATTTFTVHTDGLLLAKNISLGIDQVTESTAGNVTVIGHYA